MKFHVDVAFIKTSNQLERLLFVFAFRSRPFFKYRNQQPANTKQTFIDKIYLSYNSEELLVIKEATNAATAPVILLKIPTRIKI